MVPVFFTVKLTSPFHHLNCILLNTTRWQHGVHFTHAITLVSSAWPDTCTEWQFTYDVAVINWLKGDNFWWLPKTNGQNLPLC